VMRTALLVPHGMLHQNAGNEWAASMVLLLFGKCHQIMSHAK